MLDFKAKMHQIQFRLVLKGPTSKGRGGEEWGKGREREEREREVREGKGGRGEGRDRAPSYC